MASSELRAEGQVDSWSSETVIALIARGRLFKKEVFRASFACVAKGGFVYVSASCQVIYKVLKN